jgi:hypothetical protein
MNQDEAAYFPRISNLIAMPASNAPPKRKCAKLTAMGCLLAFTASARNVTPKLSTKVEV